MLNALKRRIAGMAAWVTAAWLTLCVRCQMALADSEVKIWGFQENTQAGETIASKLVSFSDAIIGFVAVAAVLAMIGGGFMFIISGGNDRNVETAKKIMLYSIVGMAVALFAKLIVNFAVYRLNPAS
ncbi:MAG: hypothetical protein ACPLQP_05950 [Moorellaceae bacterium]